MSVVSVGKCETSGIPIELCYETFGDPQSEPLLLIMGLGSQLLAWDSNLCNLLAERGYYVVRYDNRDVGLSTHLDELGSPSYVYNYLKHAMGFTPNPPYTLKDMATDAVRLLDALSIPKVHLVGASMGGMIAQLVALEYPDRVRSLCSIMSSTGEPHLPRPSLRILWQISKKSPELMEDRIANSLTTMKMINNPDTYNEEQARAHVISSLERSTYRGGVIRQMLAIASAPPRKKALGTLTIPALVIHGPQDPLVPIEHGQDTHEAIPGSEMLLLDEMWHSMPRCVHPQMADAIHRNAAKANAA